MEMELPAVRAKKRYFVQIGKLYFCGIGETLPAFGHDGHGTVGSVVSTIKSRAYLFEDLDAAFKCAESMGGEVDEWA